MAYSEAKLKSGYDKESPGFKQSKHVIYSSDMLLVQYFFNVLLQEGRKVVMQKTEFYKELEQVFDRFPKTI
jgi:hypothetical protein